MSKYKKKNRVILYYPQHFNRGSSGENPLFRPFIRFFELHNIRYKLIEEPDKNTIKPSNPNAIKFNLFFILACRKLIPRFLFKNFEKREQFVGKLYRWLTANTYRADVIFTLSNSLGGFWRGYNPQARIIDYQHGLINKKQTGFFNSGKAPLHIAYNTKEIAVWGRNFKQMFEQDAYYNGKVHVLGHYQDSNQAETSIEGRDVIVFMLQFMPDVGESINNTMLDILKETISQFETLLVHERPIINLKNHPRHNHVFDLQEIFRGYSFVHVLPDDVVFDAKKVLINVTYFSTAAFEMAQNGVPSFFLYNEKLPQGQHIFFDNYNYPLQKNENLLEFWMLYKNNPYQWIQHSTIVKEWGNHFFEPFDTEMLSQLIDKTEDGH